MDDAVTQGFNLVDVIFAVVLLLGVLRGYHRKLSGQIAGTVALVVGFLAGIQLFEPCDAFFLDRSRLSTEAAHAAAFITTLVLACLLMLLVRVILSRVMEFTFTPSFDHWGGAFAGLLRTVVFAVLFIVAMLMVPHDYVNRTFGEASAVGRAVRAVLPEARDALDGLRPRLDTAARMSRADRARV